MTKCVFFCLYVSSILLVKLFLVGLMQNRHVSFTSGASVYKSNQFLTTMGNSACCDKISIFLEKKIPKLDKMSHTKKLFETFEH